MFEIKDNMSLPAAPSDVKYPFDAMMVGSGFIVPFESDEEGERKRAKRRVRGAVTWANRTKAPRRFISRVLEEGIAVKRVA